MLFKKKQFLLCTINFEFCMALYIENKLFRDIFLEKYCTCVRHANFTKSNGNIYLMKYLTKS